MILSKYKYWALIKRSSALFINFGLAFFYSVVLSRVLTVADRGEFYEYQIVALICASFATLSIPQTVTVMVNKERQINLLSFISYLLCVLVLSAFLSLLVMHFLYPDKSFLLLALMVLGNALTTGFIDFFKINKDFKSFSNAYILIPVAGFFASICLWGGVAPTVSNTIYLWVLFQFIVFLFFLIYFLKEYHLELSGESLKFSTYSFVTTGCKYLGLKTLGVFSQNMDKVLFSFIALPTVSGLYAVCMSLESISSRLFKFLSDFVFSQYINDGVSFSRRVIVAYLMAALLGGLGVLVTYFYGELIITIIFGEKFSSAHEFLILIILNSVVSGWVNMFTQINLSEKRFKFIYFRQIFSVVAFFLLIYFFMQALEPLLILTVALYVSLARLFLTLLECWYSKRNTCSS